MASGEQPHMRQLKLNIYKIKIIFKELSIYVVFKQMIRKFEQISQGKTEVVFLH